MIEQEQPKKEEIKKEIVDQTKEGLDDYVKQYLSFGPDFCESPQGVPHKKILNRKDERECRGDK